MILHAVGVVLSSHIVVETISHKGPVANELHIIAGHLEVAVLNGGISGGPTVEDPSANQASLGGLSGGQIGFDGLGGTGLDTSLTGGNCGEGLGNVAFHAVADLIGGTVITQSVDITALGDAGIGVGHAVVLHVDSAVGILNSSLGGELQNAVHNIQALGRIQIVVGIVFSNHRVAVGGSRYERPGTNEFHIATGHLEGTVLNGSIGSGPAIEGPGANHAILGGLGGGQARLNVLGSASQNAGLTSGDRGGGGRSVTLHAVGDVIQRSRHEGPGTDELHVVTRHLESAILNGSIGSGPAIEGPGANHAVLGGLGGGQASLNVLRSAGQNACLTGGDSGGGGGSVTLHTIGDVIQRSRHEGPGADELHIVAGHLEGSVLNGSIGSGPAIEGPGANYTILGSLGGGQAGLHGLALAGQNAGLTGGNGGGGGGSVTLHAVGDSIGGIGVLAVHISDDFVGIHDSGNGVALGLLEGVALDGLLLGGVGTAFQLIVLHDLVSDHVAIQINIVDGQIEVDGIRSVGVGKHHSLVAGQGEAVAGHAAFSINGGGQGIALNRRNSFLDHIVGLVQIQHGGADRNGTAGSHSNVNSVNLGRSAVDVKGKCLGLGQSDAGHILLNGEGGIGGGSAAGGRAGAQLEVHAAANEFASQPLGLVSALHNGLADVVGRPELNGILEGHRDRNGLPVYIKVHILGQADGVVHGVIRGAHRERAVESALTRIINLGTGDGKGNIRGNGQISGGVIFLRQFHISGIGHAIQNVGGSQGDMNVQMERSILVLHQLPLSLNTAVGAVRMLFFRTSPAPHAVGVRFLAAVVYGLLELPLGECRDRPGRLGVLIGGINNIADIIGIAGSTLRKCGAHHTNDHHDRQQDREGSASKRLPIHFRCHNFNLLLIKIGIDGGWAGIAFPP